jgi:hypothetical protein
LVVVLVILLATGDPLMAQQRPGVIRGWLPAWQQAAPQQTAPQPQAGRIGLKIIVLEGEGVYVSPTKYNLPPVVEIRDINDRPIEGAEVTFSLPPTGPGGIFPGLQLTKTVRSNVQGQASAAGFIPNNQPGPYTIHVTATAGSLTGTAEIHQTNLVGAPEPTKQSWLGRWKFWLIAGGAAAAATGIILVTRSNGGTASNYTNIKISSGTVLIGVCG